MKLLNAEFQFNNKTYKFCKPAQSHLPDIVSLINRANLTWAHLGIKDQSPQVIESYVMVDGVIICEVNSNTPCAVICVRETAPIINGEQIIIKCPHRENTATLGESKNFLNQLHHNKFLFSYSFAVEPEMAKKGFGSTMVEYCYSAINKQGYDGFMLETGKDADWLVEWYKKLGFQIIGEGTIKSLGTNTVLMVMWHE